MADVRRLPGPFADIWDWQLRGACRGMNSELFFHPERERGPARATREAWAKTLCRGCPVLDECRSHALLVQEPYGVWGGLSESDRGRIIRAERLPGYPARTAPTGVVGVDLRRGRHRRRPGPQPV